MCELTVSTECTAKEKANNATPLLPRPLLKKCNAPSPSLLTKAAIPHNRTEVITRMNNSPEDSTGGFITGGCNDNSSSRVSKKLWQPQLSQGAEVIGQTAGEHCHAATSLACDGASVLRHLTPGQNTFVSSLLTYIDTINYP